MKNRKGIFRVSEARLMSDSPEIAELFSKMKIVKADYDFMRNEFIYYAYSTLFEELAEGECTPLYIIDITQTADGSVEFNARRSDTET